MLFVIAHLIALLGSQRLVSAAQSGSGGVSPHADAFALHQVFRRASDTDTETAHLPIIVGSSTVACQPGCTMVSRVVAQCIANGGGDLAVATCACSTGTLNIIESCALCTISDSTNQQGSLPMSAYNSFVNECISLNLTTPASLYTGPGFNPTASSVLSNVDPSATLYVEKGTASIASENQPIPTTAPGTGLISSQTSAAVATTGVMGSGTTSIVPSPSVSTKNNVSSSSGTEGVRAGFGLLAALVSVAFLSVG